MLVCRAGGKTPVPHGRGGAHVCPGTSCYVILHYCFKQTKEKHISREWGQFVITGLLRAGGKTPGHPVAKHGASVLHWGGLQFFSAGTARMQCVSTTAINCDASRVYLQC